MQTRLILHFAYSYRIILASATFLSFAFPNVACAQKKTYTVSNAHAHNDFRHPVPFFTAYNAGFGSIEVDIILLHNELYVAHDEKDIDPKKTLQSLYLNPLQQAIRKNGNYVFADSSKTLQLLVDLKTAAKPTLDKLVQVLEGYKSVTACPRLMIVITGSQPDVTTLTTYPAYLLFDGSLDKTYTAEELERIALFSHDFRKYTSWKGEGVPAEADGKKIKAAVLKAQALKKPVRFWAAPDGPNAWSVLMGFGVDYINTDKIEEITTFFSKLPLNSP